MHVRYVLAPGLIVVLVGATILSLGARGQQPAAAAKISCTNCPIKLSPSASKPLGTSTRANGTCKLGMRNGFPVPDPKCTPGATNPTVTASVLQNAQFRTGCVRDCVTSEAVKHDTYAFYNIKEPSANDGANQTCELDHLVPLELGGADTLDNIWPQCGPAGVALDQRFFKQKDQVENFLADQVRAHNSKFPLAQSQLKIAQDWTQFLQEAKQWCQSHKCEGER